MHDENSEYMDNKELIDAVKQVMDVMTANKDLMAIIEGDDMYEIQDAIAKYLIKSEYDLTDLNDEDKLQIVNDVLLEYI